MQGIIRGSSGIISKRAHDTNNINDNNNFDNNSNINDSNINDIQSLLAKNQKRKSIASKHLHAHPTTTTTTAATQARISSSRTASQAMNESRYGDQQHNNTNDDDRTNVEWQQSAEHREDP